MGQISEIPTLNAGENFNQADMCLLTTRHW